jgi:hypothetical protein
MGRSGLGRFAVGLLLALLCALLSIGIAFGGFLLWYFNRPQPKPVRDQLFSGVTYERRVRAAPRPAVINLVTVRLGTPGIRFLVTPADRSGGRQLRAQTTSAFLRRHKLQLAINGDFFYPFHSSGPWDFYPQRGDPVDVAGFAGSSGRIYSRQDRRNATLFISCSNRPSFERPPDLCHAVSGAALLEGGREVRSRAAHADAPHPRTAVALDRELRKLVLVVVDGRQPNYSSGVTLPELARLLRSVGGWWAINLDGGGSSTLVVQKNGVAIQLNSPIHARVPGWERPVANHLGLWAREHVATNRSDRRRF